MNNIEIFNQTGEEIEELKKVQEVLEYAIKFENLKNVEFNVIIDWGVEGVEGKTFRYAYGNEVKLPEPPNRVGYTFNGWKSTHTTASGTTSTDNIMGDSLPKQWLPYRYVNGMDVTLTHLAAVLEITVNTPSVKTISLFGNKKEALYRC